jgi:hypothetical protein
MEFLQKEMVDYLVRRWKLLLHRPFLFENHLWISFKCS